MNDAQRQPSDRDREALVVRVKRAGDEGRISLADRDIRLANVRSATSVAELDLMSRELDQLDATLPPRSEGPAGAVEDKPWSAFEPGKKDSDGDIPEAAVPARIVAFIFSVIVAIAIVLGGVVYVGYNTVQRPSVGTTAGGTTVPTQEPGTTEPEDDPLPLRTNYNLTVKGIRGFLKVYRQSFKTSRAVELTLYRDYAIVGVPVRGQARQEGWLYRDGKWTSFGGVRAVFPGSKVINTKRLDVPALVRNILWAKANLNVEKAKPYVVVRFIQPVDEVPRVDIHVSNTYNESGYLATTMQGKVKRAYPYGSDQ